MVSPNPLWDLPKIFYKAGFILVWYGFIAYVVDMLLFVRNVNDVGKNIHNKTIQTKIHLYISKCIKMKHYKKQKNKTLRMFEYSLTNIRACGVCVMALLSRYMREDQIL